MVSDVFNKIKCFVMGHEKESVYSDFLLCPFVSPIINESVIFVKMYYCDRCSSIYFEPDIMSEEEFSKREDDIMEQFPFKEFEIELETDDGEEDDGNNSSKKLLN